MNHILVTRENYGDFKELLPEVLPDVRRTTIGAYDDEGHVCGTVSMQLFEDGYDLDWLYVTPSRRRQGIGRGLLQEASELISHTDAMPVRAVFEASEGAPVYELFRTFETSGMGFDLSYLYDRYYIRPEMIANLSNRVLDKAKPDAGMGFFEFPSYKQRSFLLDYAKILSVSSYDVWKAACVPELCRVIAAGERVGALILVAKRTDGNLELSYLYGSNTKKLISLLKYAATEAGRLFPEAELVFDAATKSSSKLAKRLFPEAVPVPLYEAEL